MRLTIITPLHEAGNKFISAAYETLKAQSVKDWRWFILENGGGSVPEAVRTDSRVVVKTLGEPLVGIGQLKRTLCEQARTEANAVVELDCDDLLAPNALAEITNALESTGADFVYSDFAEFKWAPDGSVSSTWEHYPYSTAFGWSSYQVNFDVDGRVQLLQAMRAPEVTPQNLRLVDWSPNHVRAWRHDLYWRVGGHNEKLTVADDHDLVVRMFLAGAKFTHIPKCLYGYRVHDGNTVSSRNAEIREGTDQVYNRNIFALAEHFAKQRGLLCIDLCGALDTPTGYLAIDKKPGAQIVCDLDGPWTLPNGSVGVLRAQDALEHLRSPVHTMNEIYRVLAPGGFLLSQTPSAPSRGAFADPGHVSFWNGLSFRYYTDARYARYTADFVGRFQASRVLDPIFHSDWHKEQDLPYVEAHLIRLGTGYEPMGAVLWPTRQG